ncbi:unnamed protein product [Prunus armeniaca]|uniref:Uncharacterized protein n=1 Tax=Prunus armeniaca TaxID=36596 RepID=A0A6J5WU55_PRUAR|nr:unnamed protein product [Prunus armeniaca]
MRKCFQLLAHPALRFMKLILDGEGQTRLRSFPLKAQEPCQCLNLRDVGLVLEKNSMQVFATLFAEGLANPMC